jgi:hypothetical protein
VEDLAATITSLGALILALGTFITAVGAAWLAWRNSRRADDARVKAAVDAEAARVEAAAAALKAAMAAEAAAEAKVEIVKVGNGLFELGKAVDGRLTQLIEEIRVSEFAKGKLEGEAGTKGIEGEP